MSNFEKAFKVCLDLEMDDGDMPSSMDYARALREAGLLAPDLPEPDVIRPGSRMKFWFDENIYAYEGSGKVRVIADDVFLTVDDAREHALSVLAACEYAEKMVHDE